MKKNEISVTTGIHLELGHVKNKMFTRIEKSFYSDSIWGFDIYDSHYGIRQKVSLR